jgi:uncharacterized protein (TIRG00374 family)
MSGVSGTSGKKRLPLLLRAAVSAVLLWYVFAQVGWGALWQELRGVDPLLLALYVVLGKAATLISAWKWHVLSSAVGIAASLPRLFLLYLVGGFFNHILPTNVGGDLVRGLELGRLHGDRATAMASVFVERFTGLTTLIVLAALAVALEPQFLSDWRVATALSLVAAGYVVGGALVFSPALTRGLEHRCRVKAVAKVLGKVRSFQEAILLYRHRPGALAVSFALSLVFYANAVAITYAGCLAFGVRPAVSTLAAAVMVMLVLFMVPISLGGIGLQEWAYTFVLGLIGVPPAVGLSLGLLFRARAVGFGLIGGALYPLVTQPSLPLEPLAK